jgi:hypothetical protein
MGGGDRWNDRGSDRSNMNCLSQCRSEEQTYLPRQVVKFIFNLVKKIGSVIFIIAQLL